LQRSLHNKVAEKFEEGTLSDYITLHTKCEKDEDAIGEHTSDNDTLNEVYAWLLEHEKQDISNID
jgi:hypothetical protein